MAGGMRDLTEGPVWRGLMAVSAPMVLGLFGVLSVGLADAFFLGQVSPEALAAVGYIYPVTVAITSLSVGLAAGANAALSQAIGRQDKPREIEHMALHAIVLAFVLGTLVSLVLWLAAPILFGLMGAAGGALDAVLAYIPWWCLSFPFLTTMMVTLSAFRAHGNGAIPAAVMLLAAIVNLAVDPLLIFGLGPIPALGAEGAGMATFLGRAVAAFVAIALAIRRGLVDLGDAPLEGARHSVHEITAVGAPAAFSNAINPAGMAAVTAAVATLGQEAVAGFGAATRVQQVILVPFLALSSGIGPVVGQNWGARRYDRARRGLRQCFFFCAAWGLGTALLVTIFAGAIGQAFSDDPAAAAHCALYLRVVGWSLLGYGILVTANAAMNARSRALWAMGLSLARIFAIYLPGAWLGVWLLGYLGIVLAASIANLAAIWMALLATRATGLNLLSNPAVTGPLALAGRRIPDGPECREVPAE